MTLPLLFEAYDPYWRADDETAFTLTIGELDIETTETPWDAMLPWDADIPWAGLTTGSTWDEDVAWDDPYMPMAGRGAGTWIGAAPNNGDVPTYPRWVFDGPAEDCAAELVGVGRWEFTEPLDTGDRLIVDAHPDAASSAVTLNGVNAFDKLARTRLWRLPAGSSLIALRANNTDPSSQVAMTWTALFNSP